jgi:hypothetical protein
MSLGRTLTAAQTPTPLDLSAPVLVVASAGNSRSELGPGALEAVPATTPDSRDRILVVASHDADGRLSDFSNYGEPVSIAAPGCQIKSWTDGDGDAVAWSGTSMAAANVTFAAALLRSRWDPVRGGPALKNRLLSSARLDPKLLWCSKLSPRDETKVDRYCVKNGGMLDIEAALLTTRDLIEYVDPDCSLDAGPACPVKRAIGKITKIPASISECVGFSIHQKVRYEGFTRNGAIKRLDATRFVVQYEKGSDVGAEPLQSKICPRAANDQQQVEFTAFGPQLDGSNISNPVVLPPIDLERVSRVLTRTEKPS